MLKQISLAIAFIIFVSASLISSEIGEPKSQKQEKNTKVRIAISKEKSVESLTRYSNWLMRHNTNIEYFNLYPMGLDSAAKILKTCNGLLLTGGRDVYPDNYGKVKDTARCGSFDRYRDSLEFMLIEVALSKKMPIFGVCRGEQILNVSQGGTLYIDIPTDFDTIVKHRLPDWKLAYHDVNLTENTVLNEVAIGEQRDVVTNHHQGIEKLGTNLLISAYANDSLPEAIEWKNKEGKGFLMAVQWHPEAMDTLHPLSAPLAKLFLLESANYSISK